jgi:hypothetical protein
MTQKESENQPYTKHFDTLVALVTHLSNTQYISRTPQGIADALGLKRNEVQKVLDTFPGFFRRSRNKHSSGEHYYTVHLRHARRSLDSNQERDSAPLRPEETQALFSLISIMVAQENETARLYFQKEAEYGNLRRTLLITVVLGIVSAIAAIMAAVIASRH